MALPDPKLLNALDALGRVGSASESLDLAAISQFITGGTYPEPHGRAALALGRLGNTSALDPLADLFRFDTYAWVKWIARNSVTYLGYEGARVPPPVGIGAA